MTFGNFYCKVTQSVLLKVVSVGDPRSVLVQVGDRSAEGGDNRWWMPAKTRGERTVGTQGGGQVRPRFYNVRKCILNPVIFYIDMYCSGKYFMHRTFYTCVIADAGIVADA